MTTQEEYAERRERWAAALESGQYAQAKGALRTNDGYCCLGVACDLYAKENGGVWHRGLVGFLFNGYNTVLPEPVQEWLGLETNNGTYANETRALTSHNDSDKSFKEIAAIIRAAPAGLFSHD